MTKGVVVIMKNKIEQLLNIHGPMLSGELARHYESVYKVSNEAARQALSRVGHPVFKITKLSFEKNQKFFYLEKQFMSERFISALLNAIEKHSKINSIYISAFLSQNGYVSKELLPAFVSAPVGKVKKHKMHDRIITDLIQSQIISEFDETRWMLNPAFNRSGTLNVSRSTGLEVAKKQIVSDFAAWAGKMNLSAYSSVHILSKEAQVGNFQWAFTAPSYIHPLFDIKKSRPGFVVADVFYGKMAKKQDIQFFIDKVNVIRSFRNLPTFLPILIVDRIEQDALSYLKENKIIVAIINNIFDTKYSELLGDIVNLFTNASAIISSNPGKLEELFVEIGKSEGRFNNLAGDMFELLVGHYYHELGCNFLEIKKVIPIPDERKSREIDILVRKDGCMYIAECKATRSMIDEKFVDEWLGTKIPQIRKWLFEKHNETQKHIFQLWSIGGFTDGAETLLQRRQGDVTKYEIEFYNKGQMREIALRNNTRTFLALLDQHFKKSC